jgi:hypothetical protein
MYQYVLTRSMVVWNKQTPIAAARFSEYRLAISQATPSLRRPPANLCTVRRCQHGILPRPDHSVLPNYRMGGACTGFVASRRKITRN